MLVKKIFFRVFCCHFFSVYSSMPSKVIIVIEFMFFDINIFWALLRAYFNPRLTAPAKTSLSQAQNIFMPVNINSIVLFLKLFMNYKYKADTKLHVSQYLKARWLTYFFTFHTRDWLGCAFSLLKQ